MSIPKGKREYKKKPYESLGNSNDTFAQIYVSMMLSPAWMDLTASQKVLYMLCKAQLHQQGKKDKPNGIREQFFMNQGIWRDKYKLYKEGNKSKFYEDIRELIGHGFIFCLENGRSTRTKSVFEFSYMWQNYGTTSFTVSPSQNIPHYTAEETLDHMVSL